jgi:hypothetical protein
MAKTKLSLDPAKAALTTARAELEMGLRQYWRSLPLKKRLQYKIALAVIRSAEIKLSKAPCDPPDMTFEMPGPVLRSEELGALRKAPPARVRGRQRATTAARKKR